MVLSRLRKCKYRIYTFTLVISPFFRKALEDLGIPCFLGGMTRGMLGKSSPIHIRQNRRDALKEADLVLLAGNAFSYDNFKMTYLQKKCFFFLMVLQKTKKLHLHC